MRALLALLLLGCAAAHGGEDEYITHGEAYRLIHPHSCALLSVCQPDTLAAKYGSLEACSDRKIPWPRSMDASPCTRTQVEACVEAYAWQTCGPPDATCSRC